MYFNTKQHAASQVKRKPLELQRTHQLRRLPVYKVQALILHVTSTQRLQEQNTV